MGCTLPVMEIVTLINIFLWIRFLSRSIELCKRTFIALCFHILNFPFSTFFHFQIPLLLPNIFFCFSEHKGTTSFFFFSFLLVLLPSFVHQWIHEEEVNSVGPLVISNKNMLSQAPDSPFIPPHLKSILRHYVTIQDFHIHSSLTSSPNYRFTSSCNVIRVYQRQSWDQTPIVRTEYTSTC